MADDGGLGIRCSLRVPLLVVLHSLARGRKSVVVAGRWRTITSEQMSSLWVLHSHPANRRDGDRRGGGRLAALGSRMNSCVMTARSTGTYRCVIWVRSESVKAIWTESPFHPVAIKHQGISQTPKENRVCVCVCVCVARVRVDAFDTDHCRRYSRGSHR